MVLFKAETPPVTGLLYVDEVRSKYSDQSKALRSRLWASNIYLSQIMQHRIMPAIVFLSIIFLWCLDVVQSVAIPQGIQSSMMHRTLQADFVTQLQLPRASWTLDTVLLEKLLR